MWQDILITIANAFLGYALIPQIIKGFKEKKVNISFQTIILYAIALYMIAISFFTLELFLSSIVTGIAATLWLILFIQSIIYKN
jgi:hypothetical protein